MTLTLAPTTATPRQIIFDLDGTLVDSLPGITAAANVLRAELGQVGLSQSRVRACLGGAPGALLARVIGQVNAEADGAADRWASVYVEHGLPSMLPMAGAIELLRSLKQRGITATVLTNKRTDLALRTLQVTGLLAVGNIAQVLGPDAVGSAKPDPRGVLGLMRSYGTRTWETWLVGDGDSDILAGNAAGVVTVACRFGYGSAATTDPVGVIDGLDEITEWIEKTSRRP